MKAISALKLWMSAATPDEQKLLAERIGTSRPMLYQYAGGHREVSAARAGEIEAATRTMAKASRGRLPVILRTDLCEACRSCSYAQKCLGPRATASEFPILTQEVFIDEGGASAAG